MTIKELKALFNGRDEDENVCVEDLNGSIIRICGGSERSDCGIVLSVHQEFPETWFDEHDNEVRWINGKRVVLNYEECEDKAELDLGEFGYKEVTLKFNDGLAYGEGVRLAYPKLADITDDQIEKLDNQLGRRISDSGVIRFEDVALLLGEVESYTPVKKLDNDSHLICESIQNVTLVAWPMIYGSDNVHDINSAELLETFRSWGEEFEAWWINHSQEWMDLHDYVIEVEHFAREKATDYLANLCE